MVERGGGGCGLALKGKNTLPSLLLSWGRGGGVALKGKNTLTSFKSTPSPPPHTHTSWQVFSHSEAWQVLSHSEAWSGLGFNMCPLFKFMVILPEVSDHFYDGESIDERGKGLGLAFKRKYTSFLATSFL